MRRSPFVVPGLVAAALLGGCGGQQPVAVQAAESPCRDLPQFLTGHWVHEADGTRTEELWLAPLGERMLGVNRTVGVEGSWFEYLRVERTPESVVYIPSPGGVESVGFVQTHCTETSVVFENPSHDFPTRIEYTLHEGVLTARISGLVRGELQSMEWSFSAAR